MFDTSKINAPVFSVEFVRVSEVSFRVEKQRQRFHHDEDSHNKDVKLRERGEDY